MPAAKTPTKREIEEPADERASVKSAVDDLSSTFDAWSGDWFACTYPAAPVTLINIPEPKKVNGSFIYNYYVRDERTTAKGTLKSIDLSDPTQESKDLTKRFNLPRGVEISVEAADFGTVGDFGLDGIVAAYGSNIVTDNINRIHPEGAVSSGLFAGIKLQDSQIDQSFYYALSSSVAFFKIEENTSGNSQANALIDNLSISTSFGPNGSQIRDSLSNMQSQGVSYSPTDVRKEISNQGFNSVRFIDFNLNVNNRVISNLLKGSVEDKTNIFEDEIASIIEQSSAIQSKAIQQSLPGVISSEDYEVQIESLGDFSIPTSIQDIPAFNEGSVPVGYIIEKFEIFRNEDGSTDRISHPPLSVNKYGNIKILDPSVKYGSTYIYNIKTVSLTRFESLLRDMGGEVQDQAVISVIMVASSGTLLKVECTESIPPNPPGNISFKYDYKNSNLMIFWEEEQNPQRDVVRYQIFRRKSIKLPFTLVRELDFDFSTSKVSPVEKAPERLITKVGGPRKFYRDIGFTMDSKYIYSICCSDARGLTSNYSSQFEVTFNRGRNKIETKLISKSGAPKPYPNMYLNKDLFVDTMKDSGHSRMRVFFDPEYYDVTKPKISTSLGSDGKTENIKRDVSLGLIGNNYKIQIINVDSQLGKTINIDIKDLSGPPIDIPTSKASFTTLAGLSQSSADST